jgi:hypothetical protein
VDTREFEVQQLLWAYRRGVISDELFEQQINELAEERMGTCSKLKTFSRHCSAKSPARCDAENAADGAMIFSIPANFGNYRENSHKGDQIIYVIERRAAARVSGKAQGIKPGDVIDHHSGGRRCMRCAPPEG